MDKCEKCYRHGKCKSIVEQAKIDNSPLLALVALCHCPVAHKKEDNNG